MEYDLKINIKFNHLAVKTRILKVIKKLNHFSVTTKLS